MKPSRPALKNPCSSVPKVTKMDLTNKTWKVEEIFQEIPGDPDNVNMIIPDEIVEYLGLKAGDPIRIQVTEDGLIISRDDENSL